MFIGNFEWDFAAGDVARFGNGVTVRYEGGSFILSGVLEGRESLISEKDEGNFYLLQTILLDNNLGKGAMGERVKDFGIFLLFGAYGRESLFEFNRSRHGHPAFPQSLLLSGYELMQAVGANPVTYQSIYFEDYFRNLPIDGEVSKHLEDSYPLSEWFKGDKFLFPYALGLLKVTKGFEIEKLDFLIRLLRLIVPNFSKDCLEFLDVCETYTRGAMSKDLLYRALKEFTLKTGLSNKSGVKLVLDYNKNPFNTAFIGKPLVLGLVNTLCVKMTFHLVWSFVFDGAGFEPLEDVTFDDFYQCSNQLPHNFFLDTMREISAWLSRLNWEDHCEAEASYKRLEKRAKQCFFDFVGVTHEG